jgi:hypothetical protein
MPEINHKDQPSIPALTPQPSVAKAIADAGVTTSDLEKQIAGIIAKRHAEAAKAATPKEPDWKTLTEAESYSPSVFIPVIDHDIPDYMNIKLKDTEYEPVWASRDQRRLGQLLAEGYEFITPDMMAPEFHVPLLFDSDKHYVYQDVIAMRVHKRIVYGKRRRALEISKSQLRNDHKIPKVKAQMESGDDEIMFEPGLSTYDTR